MKSFFSKSSTYFLRYILGLRHTTTAVSFSTQLYNGGEIDKEHVARLGSAATEKEIKTEL
jgi:hypothetical protein